MEKDKKSIACLVNRIIAKDGFFYCKCLFSKYEEDPCLIINHYYKDIIDELSLIKLIRKSIIISRIQLFIPDILSLVNETSITDKVLNNALHYPGKFRKTLLIQLSHMWLTPDQLERLNEKMTTPEAYYKLFLIYTTSPNTSLSEFKSFLNKNKKFITEIASCCNLFQERGYPILEEKLNFARTYVKNYLPSNSVAPKHRAKTGE